ncbi:MAG: Cas10/Cmr2 second palm domain-containing protein [Methylobacter sp.]
MSYYLRFEGVNLSNFIYDTNDLSTIRGGGLLLLNAPEEVQKIIKKELSGFDPDKDTISKGASWALFKLETDNEKIASTIKENIITRLNAEKDDNQPNPLRHATFVVDILKKTELYQQDRDSLHALNRWQQMQAPSLSIPQAAEAVCEFDKVRPGSEKIPVKSDHEPNKIEEKTASPSVKMRNEYGRGQKRGKFYKDRTGLDLKFTSDLQELSSDPAQGILNGKIAVIYVDGNKFGDIARDCINSEEQTQFDQQLREGQSAILKTLLEEANINELWKYEDEKNNKKIRLETLLWGGDELIWVVPAWLGWYTLNLFFKQADEKIKIINQKILERTKYPSKNGELSYAAGLVFCHHNAPIHRITALAHNLAEIPKKQKEYKYKNMVAYQILESFDHAGTDIERHRLKRLANIGSPNDLLIAADKMEELEKLFQTLKDHGFPRRKSYQLIKILFEIEQLNIEALNIKMSGGNEYNKLKEQLENRQKEVKFLQDKLLEEHLTTLEELKNLCGGNNAHWLHLTDLWDFIALNKGGNNHD